MFHCEYCGENLRIGDVNHPCFKNQGITMTKKTELTNEMVPEALGWDCSTESDRMSDEEFSLSFRQAGLSMGDRFSIALAEAKRAREAEKEWKKLCDEWAEKYLQLDAENASLRKTKRLRKEGDGDE